MATNQQQTKALDTTKNKLQTVRDLLGANAQQIKLALPKHVSADRMQRCVLTACLHNPDLLECTQQSVMLAVLRAAQMGIEPDGTLGYLVPYERNVKDKSGNWSKIPEAQFLPSYRGLVQLARQSGEIATVVARVVYEGDEFNFSMGTDEKIVHVPLIDDGSEVDDRGDPIPRKAIYFYAVAKFRTGEVQFDIMTRAQVERVRARSKAKSEKTPWFTDYEEMAKKTIVKRLMKMLPISVHLRDALAEEEAIEQGNMISPLQMPTNDEPTKPVSKLDAVVAAKKQEAAAETINEKPAEEAKPAAAASSGPDINTLRARALMGHDDAIDELASMGMKPGIPEEINVDRLSKEVGAAYRAWLSGKAPK